MWKTPYKVAILTASDKGAAGQRVDESGPLLAARMAAQGCPIAATALLPDDQAALSAQLLSWCKGNTASLILTTGGTGLSPRDCMPEATLAIAQRLAPGLAEGIRAHSMAITKRAMLSRGVAVLCQHTLIINLPGSPKAAGEALDAVLPVLEHALDILCAGPQDCAR